ncbi:hypothetical protein [Rhizobium leguminosarum]|uniref:hypothetical protein n=1 Tax=Rhizobium leguminosarum TaxID=384 RepID=UPI00140FE4A9|nr:hypothetical protein [Rhizobium leguminosarum]QIO68176.1 hypothetical protein HA462_25110 [Rhizobium leguminosarum bv. trifolii]
MKTNRTKVGWAIGVVVVAGIIVPVLLGEPRSVSGQEGGDYWRNTIYDFQTLITGLAAVLAAAFTVGKMQQTIDVMERTDRESDRRHRELTKLGLRSEKLKMERVLFPQLFELRATLEHFKDFGDLREIIEPDRPEHLDVDWHWFSEVTRRHADDFAKIREVLQRPQFIDGLPLFDGITTRNLEELDRHSRATMALIERFFEVQNSEDYYEYQRYEFNFTDNFPYNQAMIEGAVIHLVAFAADMERMSDAYERDPI